MVFKFEGLVAIGALELAQSSRFVVTNHVTLQTVDVGEILLTHTTRLDRRRNQGYEKQKRNEREKIERNLVTDPFCNIWNCWS